MRNTKERHYAVAVLMFVAALVTAFAPAARADSDTHITLFSFTLKDSTSGDETKRSFLFPGELIPPTFSEGIVSFTDVTAAQKAPEPGSVTLLALGLGLLVWFGKNRTAVYQVGGKR
jgi:hypothetical protein